MTSALLGVRPCGSGAATPRAHCSTAGPGRAPSKLATSSPLKTSASPRSISQTILTVGIAGEGEVAWKRGPERLGRWPAALSSLRLPLPGLHPPPVRTFFPPVQGPTQDSGQWRQPPLAVPQPCGEQQVPCRAQEGAVGWVPGNGLWGRPSWPRRLEPRFQPWTLDEKHAINKMYSYFGPPRPSSG